MDGGAWWAAIHGVAKSRTRLSDFTFTFHFHALEKEMATHSSVLAWRVPGTGEPGGLPSMGSHRVGHDWSDLAVAAAEVEPYHLVVKNLKPHLLWNKLPNLNEILWVILHSYIQIHDSSVSYRSIEKPHIHLQYTLSNKQSKSQNNMKH